MKSAFSQWCLKHCGFRVGAARGQKVSEDNKLVSYKKGRLHYHTGFAGLSQKAHSLEIVEALKACSHFQKASSYMAT
jgi:hypothetical protein